MCSVSFDVLALWSWPTGSIGVFLGLEVEPPQHLGLFRPVKGCQMNSPQSHDTTTFVYVRYVRYCESTNVTLICLNHKNTIIRKYYWGNLCARWRYLRTLQMAYKKNGSSSRFETLTLNPVLALPPPTSKFPRLLWNQQATVLTWNCLYYVLISSSCWEWHTVLKIYPDGPELRKNW